MKLFIERTNEWIPVEMISENPERIWEFEWRNKKYTLTQNKREDIGKKIINNINDMLDVELINNDMISYRKTMKFKG